jgi:hypothetical protein
VALATHELSGTETNRDKKKSEEGQQQMFLRKIQTKSGRKSTKKFAEDSQTA